MCIGYGLHTDRACPYILVNICFSNIRIHNFKIVKIQKSQLFLAYVFCMFSMLIIFFPFVEDCIGTKYWILHTRESYSIKRRHWKYCWLQSHRRKKMQVGSTNGINNGPIVPRTQLYDVSFNRFSWLPHRNLYQQFYCFNIVASRMPTLDLSLFQRIKLMSSYSYRAQNK